jgi:hypothetical protein
MEITRAKRRPRQLFLDVFFAAMVMHFFVTGNIVPQPLIDLFHDQPQVVVSVEPEFIPDVAPAEAPLIEDGETLPETHSKFRGHGEA